jgi:hypothetical protein
MPGRIPPSSVRGHARRVFRVETDPPLVIAHIGDDDVPDVVDLWHACGLARPWDDPYADILDASDYISSTVLVGKTVPDAAPRPAAAPWVTRGDLNGTDTAGASSAGTSSAGASSAGASLGEASSVTRRSVAGTTGAVPSAKQLVSAWPPLVSLGESAGGNGTLPGTPQRLLPDAGREPDIRQPGVFRHTGAAAPAPAAGTHTALAPAPAPALDLPPGAIVTTALAGFDGHRGWIYYLAVHPGIADPGGHLRVMVRAAEDWLTQAGARKIQVQVRGSDQAGRARLMSLGFVDLGTTVLGRWTDEE